MYMNRPCSFKNKENVLEGERVRAQFNEYNHQIELEKEKKPTFVKI